MGQWKRSLELFSAMEAKQAPRDIVTYGAVLTAVSKAGKWERAFVLLAAMEENKLEADAVAYGCGTTRSPLPRPSVHARRALSGRPRCTFSPRCGGAAWSWTP